MSKIICDVCGTSYPDASAQCPICGCVRPVDAQSIHTQSSEEPASGGYQHVKGGRFSKANVRKRNAAAQKTVRNQPEQTRSSKTKRKKKKSANTGLIITIFVLLLAILAVIGYIVVKFFVPTGAEDNAETIATSGIEDTAPTTDPVIPCLELTLGADAFTLNAAGEQVSLNAAANPVDTTDVFSYASDNEAVATVDEAGVVTAVDFGSAVITVTCGSITTECSITVEEAFVLDTNSIVLNKAGAFETIYTGSLPISEITWTTDDDQIAVIADGVVTAVANGETTVHGTYKDLVLDCTVSCKFDETQATEATEATTATEPVEAAPKPYRLKNLIGVSSSDVTLRVGESFILALLDANGKQISGVTWTVDGSCCSVDDGTVKAVSSGYGKVIATYNGETFSCIVRVR